MWPLCLCSLNTKFSRFICIIACICTPSPFIPECYSVVWLYYTLFICSSLDGHLSCFHLFATVFSTATHIRIKVFGWTPAFFFFFNFFSTFIYLFFWDRERQSMNGGGAEREGDTELETSSRLWAISPEPDAGLELPDREIVTWLKSDA